MIHQSGQFGFQMKVWNALLTIPLGETRSYKEIAIQVGSPKAARAVGMANNRNPISIIVPCHRVIGHDGNLVGYGGGIFRKQYLLGLEKPLQNSKYFEYGAKEIEYLKSRDPILAAAIDEIGPIKRAVIPDIFIALVNFIVGQQISSKSKATVWQRIQDRFSPLSAETIGALSIEELQNCGMSMRKASYIKEIADVILEGSLNLIQLQAMSDQDVSERLVQIKGIGPWTAEMVLIFSMQRPNIMSWGDLAIIRGLRMLYGHSEITPALFAKYKNRYSPYATVASLYLWEIASGNYPKFTDPALETNTK